jgi:pyruvate dehydrogenase E1 component beta subunit
MTAKRHNYGTAMLSAFDYLLTKYPEVFVIGQGLWSPWYVGNTMTDLEKKFGTDRVIDTPVSESACTGAAVGAALAGMKPIVVHPRMDFMLYAMDAIVNQAAKWSLMIGGQAHPGLTIRGIINRGGEQGAQHSQALQAWFAHVPGLRVVMPATVADSRDLLIASVLSPDPVLFIDDRWLYDLEADLPPIKELDLAKERPKCLRQGVDITLVASSYSTRIALEVADKLAVAGISAEVIDLRILNPFYPELIVDSVKRTKRLVVIDGGWRTCGISSEVVASVMEKLHPVKLLSAPLRITLPDCAAPTSRELQKSYYPSTDTVYKQILILLEIKND